MPLTTTTPINIKTPKVSGGFTVGQSATDLVSFYGATPIDQAAAITSPGSTAATTTTPWGYGSSTQADAVVTSVRAILVALRDVGIIAT